MKEAVQICGSLAIWVPPVIARAIQDIVTKCQTAVGTQNSKREIVARQTLSNSPVMPFRPWRTLPPYSSGGYTARQKIPAVYTESELEEAINDNMGLEKRRFDECVDHNHDKCKPGVDYGLLSPGLVRTHARSTDNIVPTSDCRCFVAKKEADEVQRIYHQLRDACTQSLDVAALSRGLRRNKSISHRQDRREWRYWGIKPIPSIIDPPTFEPYKDAPICGDLASRLVHPGRAEPLAVTGNPIKAVSFRMDRVSKCPSPVKIVYHQTDSRQVHMALRDPVTLNQLDAGTVKSELARQVVGINFNLTCIYRQAATDS